MKNVYQITEYGSFVSKENIPGYEYLPPHVFSQLEEFILTNRGKGTEAVELMGISARKGVGKVITAKNYVGIITMKDGTSIEILPKIYSKVKDCTVLSAKNLLIDMLKTLRDSPYRTMQTSNVNIEKMSVFEIFIKMFVDETFYIVKRGLKCSYETVEENFAFFKGKIKFGEQIKYNSFHKERSFVEYDTFSVNRPENRLIKATLLYLYSRSSSVKNRNKIKILLNFFGDVQASTDYVSDFAKYTPDRNMNDYATVLLWCKVFLTGKSFTSYAGAEVAVALLFPMQTLFENYVASIIKKEIVSQGYTVSVQDKSFHLFDEPNKQFLIKPDIVIKRKLDGKVFIIDTKWKLLSVSKPHYGISQADMYQMYAYQKKYSAHKVTLLYPQGENIGKDIDFESNDGVRVSALFVDLFNVREFARRQEYITE